MRLKDLTGQKFGRLSVIERSGSTKSGGNATWSCICDCGRTTTVESNTLRRGDTVSCGCWRKEILLHTKHGESACGTGTRPTTEYTCWVNMRLRCFNPNDQHWADYGGRGITVCERWRDSFENFLVDMGRKPTSAHSIDRWPNNDGNYELSNCRWATQKEQASNRRKAA